VAANPLHDKIRAILLAEWDPIGIRDVAQADDEYDPYIAALATMVRARISVAELANYLLQIETASMGLPGNKERAQSVAEALRNLENSGA